MKGRVLAPGEASGRALLLDDPLSLWGGIDPASGLVIDAHHPRHGEDVTGRVLVMPAVRGSSSSSSVLAEAVRSGHAPAALLLGEADLILAVGSVVASELYGRAIPVIVLATDALAAISEGSPITVLEDGSVYAPPPHDD